MRNTFLIFLSIFLVQNAVGQITAKVVDASTSESIPYANIQINGSESTISNAEGYFTISEIASGDSSTVIISYLGYATAQMTVGELKNRQLKVVLVPQMFELDEVRAAKLPSAGSIMAAVKKNLKQNYTTKQIMSKDQLFMRQSSAFFPKQLNFEITKSPGISKSATKSANQEIAAFTSPFLKNPPHEFTDMMCHYYTAPGKTGTATKLEVIKATKLKDESRSLSTDDMEKNATKLFYKYLDSTKYYRIKSGWFGTHDTVTLRKDYKKKKTVVTDTQLASSKSNIFKFLNESNFLYNAELDFVNNPERYKYTYQGAVLTNGQEFAYVLTFVPDSRKAKYIGKLYISENDFAVIRADYALAEGEKLNSLNLKLLLGVKTSQYINTGTLIYKRRPSGEGYGLQYASKEEGQYIYLNRPLKFIELVGKEEKDAVSLDIKIEANTVGKTEYLDMSRDEITQAEFDGIGEKDFKYTRIKRYDPQIWKDYGAIEPLQEMKRYEIGEEMQ